jgi:gamma-glutamyl-gamma-aminobutyrate hydrolase PuuD
MRLFVLVPSDVKSVEGHPFHCVGEKYINAVAHGTSMQPLLPLFFTGSTSNVEPAHYG